MTDVTMNVLYQQLAKKEQDAKAVNDEVKDLKAAIRAEMEERGISVYDGSGWRATISETVSNSFDDAAFKAAHKRLYDKYMVQKTGTRFTVNAIKS